MLKLFQRNMVVQALLIVVAMLVLWGGSLLTPPAVEAAAHPGVLYAPVARWLTNLPRLAVVLTMLLVLAEAIWLNILLSSAGLVSQNSLLPTLLYLVAMSAGAATLTPLVFVGAALIACLDKLLLRGTLLTIPSSKACGATMLIGIASLFYPPAVLFMLSYLLIAASYRLYNWRDWAVMILGFAAPYLLLVLVLYLTDGLDAWWATTLNGLSNIGFHAGNASSLSIASGALLAGVLLWGLFVTGGRLTERPVVWQKNATTVMLFLVGGIALLLYMPLFPLGGLLAAMALPFTFCTYRLLTAGAETTTGFGRRRRKAWIYDLLLILILIAALLC
jgi:hypothetical protein